MALPGIVPEFRTCHKGHAIRAVRYVSNLPIEKPPLPPVLRAGIKKHLIPFRGIKRFKSLRWRIQIADITATKKQAEW